MPGSHSKKDKLKKKIAKKKDKSNIDRLQDVYEHREKKKEKKAKIRKADQQDINRVKRWNSRSFNKKKELSGPTEPVFKPTAATNPLTGRPHPGMRGDELTAKLRNRIARFRQPGGPQFNISNKEHRRWVLQEQDPQGGLNKYDYEPSSYPSVVEKGSSLSESKLFDKKNPDPLGTDKQKPRVSKIKKRIAKVRKADGGVAPNYNNPSKVRKKKSATKAAAKSKSGYMGDATTFVPWGEEEVEVSFRDLAQFHRKRLWNEEKGTYPQIWQLGKNITAEGQGARNVFDAAHQAESNFAEEMGGPKYQKNMHQQITHLIKEYGPDPESGKGGTGDIESEISIADAYDMGNVIPEEKRTELKTKQEREKMGKRRKQKTAAGMANIGKKPWMQKDYLKKKGKHLEKTALRSNVNKGVNKVNPIKPTKTYKKPPQGPNPHAETPEGIRKNAEVVGRKNDTYIGKIKKKKKKYDLSKDDDFDVDAEREIARERMLERSQASAETQPQYGKTRKRIARIRKATEQIDPRVKKRKTVRPDSPVQKVSQMKDRIAELKTAKEHSHSIAFRKHEGQYYKRASLAKQEGKYAKYWLLNAKQTNGNGWGVSPTSIAKNINKFIGRPFVVTAKQWVAESEYGEQFEHPYLPTNNIDQIINHQEKFRVGSIVDVVEKDGDYHAVIEINSKFANMMLPPFCSPAIFQNNPGEADGEISDWEALHLAGLMEDPAYGARIALLKGSCVGTAEACSIQFKAAKQTTMCPKKKAKLVRRIDRLGD